MSKKIKTKCFDIEETVDGELSIIKRGRPRFQKFKVMPINKYVVTEAIWLDPKPEIEKVEEE